MVRKILIRKGYIHNLDDLPANPKFGASFCMLLALNLEHCDSSCLMLGLSSAMNLNAIRLKI